ncbi:MAG: hypothetical protein V2A70_00780 [Candidatus Omnitrophota bacterium]
MPTISIQTAQDLPTQSLEEYIQIRYESGALQGELDVLETIYARRVSEEDLNVTEEDISMSEEQFNGASFEEELFDAYRRYLQPQGRRDGLMDDKDIVSSLRSMVQDAAFFMGGLKDHVTDNQMLEAAKDVYERKIGLINRYKSRLSHRSFAF